jgi:hypothetical protein
MRCAVCAVGVDAALVSSKPSRCNLCEKIICAECVDEVTIPFRCGYCVSIMGDGEGVSRTKSFRDLGSNCMGQHIAFVEVDEHGDHTKWRRGTLLVRNLPSRVPPQHWCLSLSLCSLSSLLWALHARRVLFHRSEQPPPTAPNALDVVTCRAFLQEERC